MSKNEFTPKTVPKPEYDSICELWQVYMKMPVRNDFATLDDYDTALFDWCIRIENKFHEYELETVSNKKKESL